MTLDRKNSESLLPPVPEQCGRRDLPFSPSPLVGEGSNDKESIGYGFAHSNIQPLILTFSHKGRRDP